ncbi:MAG TPA: beta/gamma crystallin-related protein [Thermoanaerobaculia bacterium]|nr:beta/gamma crystallin-related protein [Thermoanaerobaculia bacterium]
MSRITVYQHVGYVGLAFGALDSVPSLVPFNLNDHVSSVDVESGKWELYEHVNFTGQRWIVEADGGPARNGGYPTFQNWNGPNDIISSIKKVG